MGMSPDDLWKAWTGANHTKKDAEIYARCMKEKRLEDKKKRRGKRD